VPHPRELFGNFFVLEKLEQSTEGCQQKKAASEKIGLGSKKFFPRIGLNFFLLLTKSF
jgi:hypothetical protein